MQLSLTLVSSAHMHSLSSLCLNTNGPVVTGGFRKLITLTKINTNELRQRTHI